MFERVWGYDRQVHGGPWEGKWSRKRPGQRSGSDDYERPIGPMERALRASHRDLPAPAYFPKEEACLFEETCQMEPRYDDHPASARKPSHLSRRRTVHEYPEVREIGMYPDDVVPEGSIRRSARRSSKAGYPPPMPPQVRDFAEPMAPPSLRRSAIHASACVEPMGPPSLRRSAAHASAPGGDLPLAIRRSERASQRLAHVYEGRERHSHDFSSRSRRGSVHSGRDNVHSHRESVHSRRGSVHSRRESVHSHRESVHQGSRSDHGGRQYTIHDDFAKAPSHAGSAKSGGAKAPSHVRSAKTGGTKQKAILYGSNKAVTLADF
ncbi:MAG: hypothetical protein Q9221_003329 [Calogaya cf. arnoldii]